MSKTKVQRAVFLAAGFGVRMVPVTLTTPKPLVRVHGVRIIDTLLDAVVSAGIEEIIIVRGYLHEQFDQLLSKYPNIHFVENPLYDQANNISSAYYAREYFKNAYVFEADLFLRNPNLITPYQNASNYLGVPVSETDDWMLQATDGIVTDFGQGGKNCYQCMGISYWTEQDGARLADHLGQTWENPERRQSFWDFTPLVYFKDAYRVSVRACTFDDIVEIDSFAELQALDSSYQIPPGDTQ